MKKRQPVLLATTTQYANHICDLLAIEHVQLPFMQYNIPPQKIPKIKSKTPPKYLLNMGCNSCSGIKIQTLNSFNKFFFFLTLKIETSILYTFICIITSIFTLVFVRARRYKADTATVTWLNYYPLILVTNKSVVYAILQ